MNLRIPLRLWREVDHRLLWNFVHNFGWKGMRAVQRFEKRLKRGKFFPAFVFVSITDRCNLSCQGCWITTAQPPRELSAEDLDGIITQCKAQGSHFFGILGGEPMLHEGLLPLFERHPDCYFLLFTNGTLLDDAAAAALARVGNVSPLISIEGNESVSDVRRGGEAVYSRALQAVENCRRHRLVTGVATSVCKTNQADLASAGFLNRLAELGVHYCWYYIYRPVGPVPAPELALSDDEILSLREFMVDARLWAPLVVVDAYWDHDGNALCPAAVGISHHIGPGGDIEVCPPIQFARENIGDNPDLAALFQQSDFLRSFRAEICDHTRGCVLLDDPSLLHRFMSAQQARDTSGRQTGLEELLAMQPRASHHQPGKAIPERSWAYRFAKKYWFFGFGAYG